MLKNLAMFFVLWSLLACTKDVAVVGDSDEIKKLQQQLADAQSKNAAQNNSSVTLSSDQLAVTPPAQVVDDSFLKNLCQMIKSPSLQMELAPYLAADTTVRPFLEQMSSLVPYANNCIFKRKLAYEFPMDYAEYDFGNFYVYASVHYSRDFKVENVILLPSQFKLKFQIQKLPMRDQVTLTTLVISLDIPDMPKMPTVLMRTPYQSREGMYLWYANETVLKGRTLVVQSNRGTYSSGGDFQWLETTKNSQDAEDTIQWIAKQSFSNGKVIAYGNSYDGFNALAASINNPKGLEAVIACSAPANASTDSFTEGKMIDKTFLAYLQNHANDSSSSPRTLDIIPQWLDMNYLAKADQLILNQNLLEWQDVTTALTDPDDKFWHERSLYKDLEKTTVPMLHIAGLSQDQDGRDTLLTYNHLQKHSAFKQNHRLVLHPEGHGCLGASDLPVFKMMMARADDPKSSLEPMSKVPQVVVYNYTRKSFVGAATWDQLPIEKISAPFGAILSLDDAMYGAFTQATEETSSKSLQIPTGDDFYITGSVELKLKYTSSAPDVPLFIKFWIIRPDGSALSAAPARIVLDDPEFTNGEKSVTMQLIGGFVPKGSRIIFNFSTFEPGVALMISPKRQNFTLNPIAPPRVHLFAYSEVIMTKEKPLPSEPADPAKPEWDLSKFR